MLPPKGLTPAKLKERVSPRVTWQRFGKGYKGAPTAVGSRSQWVDECRQRIQEEGQQEQPVSDPMSCQAR